MIRRPSIALAVGIGLSLAILSLGCARLGPGISGMPCPVDWVPSEALDPRSASMRARMQMTIAGEEIHLELISEARPDALVVVALARFGVRLFAVHQRGTVVSVEGASSRQLEQVAIWVMDALHRSFWIEANPQSPGTPANEIISEIQRSHGLRREFSVDGHDGAAPGTATSRVTIDYYFSGREPVPESAMLADEISIRNPWCGYEAMIVPIRAASATR